MVLEEIKSVQKIAFRSTRLKTLHPSTGGCKRQALSACSESLLPSVAAVFDMKPDLSWSDQVPERENQPKSNSINDLCFSPDGSQLVVAVGNRVLVYDGAEGELLHSLRGHKDTVYTVKYAKDGKHFASGGADRNVIIWTSKADGILKYTHNESITSLAYSPCTTKLASCTQLDFGLWGQEQKSVNKHKVHAKILSADWSSDGLHLALGFIDGHVGIRDAEGVEKATITRGGPVWCLAWCPEPEDREVLALGCWDQTLSFYLLSGEQHIKDRKLGYNPCSISYLNGGSYIAIGGSNHEATLCTKEGVSLCSVCNNDGWIWAVAGRSGHDEIAVGGDGGSIQVHKLQFQHVTAIYEERYAYRENMSDVIVQHLVSEQKVRIKCRDYVEQIAIFRDRLAVRLPDKVHVYELIHHEDNFDLRYRLKEKIYVPSSTNSKNSVSSAPSPKVVVPNTNSNSASDGKEEYKNGDRVRSNGNAAAREESFLLVTWSHVVICKGRMLRLYDFTGALIRDWILDAAVRSAQVNGGPAGGELLLLGLENGAVTQVFVNNPFTLELVKATAAVVCCDMSLHRSQVAVVDANSRVMVFDVVSKEIVFQEPGASSVTFNSSLEDMVCYSGNGKLYLRTGSFQVQEQVLDGEVASYRGSRVITLKGTTLSTLDVSLTKMVYQYLDKRDFKQAHAVACLGVTQRDWRVLGTSALETMQFDVSRKAFVRLRDVHFVDVLAEIEMRSLQEAAMAKDPESRMKMEADASAELSAHQGMYQDAAKAWARNGMVDKAIAMFIDLRQWEEAKLFAASSGSAMDAKDLTRRQAEWAEEVGDWAVASDLFAKSGAPLRAAEITCKGRGEGWQDALAEIVRSVPKTEAAVLSLCGKELSLEGFDDLAREAYLKMDDFSNIMALYVKSQNWSEAVKLSEEHSGKFDDSVFLPYALWLRDKGRFDEALGAFLKAGRRDLSRAMTERLILNAVTKTRFSDASYYYWRSAMEAFATADNPNNSEKEIREAWLLGEEHSHLADLYHAFHHVHSFTTDPFTSLQPEVLLQVSRFLVNSLGDAEPPRGISRAHTLYTLAKQAKVLGAFKLARFAYDRLQRQRVPPLWQDQIDLDMLTVQAKPVRDSPELFAACFRCGASNLLLSPFTAMSSATSTPAPSSGGAFGRQGYGTNSHGGSHHPNHRGSAWGDACTTCRHPFVRSFFNFESLPLVEFQPEPGISEEEALEMIRDTPKQGRRRRRGSGAQWREAKEGDVDVMALGGDDSADERDVEVEGENIGGDELFNRCINNALEAQEDSTEYATVVVPVRCLRGLKREDVFRVPKGTRTRRAQFYKNMMPDIPLALSQPCGRFFHEEDFEFAYLREGRCPFSRVKDVGDYGSC